MSILLPNLTEMQTWDLLQSLIENFSPTQMMSKSQTSSVTLNSVVLTAYTAVLILTNKVSLAKAYLALISSVLIGYFFINAITGWQYYLILSLIYGLTIVSIRQIKIMTACCMMMSFTLYMTLDELFYGTDKTWVHIEELKTWAWVHYELVVGFIHCLIISASVNWNIKPIERGLGWIARFVRGVCHSLGCSTRL